MTTHEDIRALNADATPEHLSRIARYCKALAQERARVSPQERARTGLWLADKEGLRLFGVAADEMAAEREVEGGR